MAHSRGLLRVLLHLSVVIAVPGIGDTSTLSLPEGTLCSTRVDILQAIARA